MSLKDIETKALLAQATANGYKSGAHREKDAVVAERRYVKMTLKNHKSILGRYDKWVDVVEMERRNTAGVGIPSSDPIAENSHNMMPPRIQNGLPPLDLAIIKDFFRFHVATSKGRIDQRGRTTVDSVNGNAEFFFAAFTRATGNMIPDQVTSAVYNWVKNDLLQEGMVSNEKKGKHLWSRKEYNQFQGTFWTCNNSVFGHPRHKIQTAWLISVFCWTGARIGAFFPDSENKDKCGLRYKDITVVLKRVAGGGWKMMYKVDQHWVKNNRDPEFTAYVASTSQDDQLRDDDCHLLLAMALEDKAIFGIDSIEHLREQEIPPGNEYLQLRWNDSVLNQPIARKANLKDGVTNKPYTEFIFTRIFKTVQELAGVFL